MALASRREDVLEHTAREFRSRYGATVLVVPTDVTAETDVKDLFDRTVRELGRLDILVNNAGTGAYVSLEEMSLDLCTVSWR